MKINFREKYICTSQSVHIMVVKALQKYAFYNSY